MEISFLLDPISSLREEEKQLLTTKDLLAIWSQEEYNPKFSVKRMMEPLPGAKEMALDEINYDKEMAKIVYSVDLKLPSRNPNMANKFPSIYDTETWVVGESRHYVVDRSRDPDRYNKALSTDNQFMKRICAKVVWYLARLPYSDRLNLGDGRGIFVATSLSQGMKLPMLVYSEQGGTVWKVNFLTILSQRMTPRKGTPPIAVESYKKHIDTSYKV